MRLKHDIHLAYCTNIHRGETWEQTFGTLREHTLAVRDRVSPGAPYAIGLRLGNQASLELSAPGKLQEFQRWLEKENCYVFTINGFPYGSFHGSRVKEQVYAPDWTTRERVEYTCRLFDLLAQLVPRNVEGSVSTVPCSFKEFIHSREQVAAMRSNVWKVVDYIAALSANTGRTLHLGLEPEPLCFLETSDEAVRFFEELRADRPGDSRIDRHLGVNYDTCHLAIEYENAADSIRNLQQHGIKISKLHFSSALKVRPTREARQALAAFVEPVYFHQVIARWPDGRITRTRDLDVALVNASELDALPLEALPEWRIHFHIPLHSPPTELFETTSSQILGVIDLLAENPALCKHIEMETYTWEVLPAELKKRSVVDQLADEYAWTLDKLRARGLA